jgi:hypothetical protein
MDSWSEKQVKALKLGGNKRLNDFLTKHGVPVDSIGIPEKYSCPTAEYYRECLTAQISGGAPPSGGAPKYSGKPRAASGGAGRRSSRTNLNAARRGPGTNKDFATASVSDRKRMEEEARERMRKKFGASSGLGSGGAFANQAVGSHGLHREPQGSAGGADDWFASVGSAFGGLAKQAQAAVKKVDWEGHRQRVAGAVTGAADHARAAAADPAAVGSSWGAWASGIASKAARAAQGVASAADGGSPLQLYRREGADSIPKLYKREDLGRTRGGGKRFTGFGGGGGGGDAPRGRNGNGNGSGRSARRGSARAGGHANPPLPPASGDMESWGDGVEDGWGETGGWGDEDGGETPGGGNGGETPGGGDGGGDLVDLSSPKAGARPSDRPAALERKDSWDVFGEDDWGAADADAPTEKPAAENAGPSSAGSALGMAPSSPKGPRTSPVDTSDAAGAKGGDAKGDAGEGWGDDGLDGMDDLLAGADDLLKGLDLGGGGGSAGAEAAAPSDAPARAAADAPLSRQSSKSSTGDDFFADFGA